MFEKIKEKKRRAEEEKAAKQKADAELRIRANWLAEGNNYSELVDCLLGRIPNPPDGIVLKENEFFMARISGAGLVEDRHAPGHYTGVSQGVSFPIGKIGNRPIRYHVGASRGHYVQGALTPTNIDSGIATLTNQRIVFQGHARTSECLFSKLIGIQHTPGEISISVSNRQKPTNIFYGEEIDDWFTDRLNLAMGIFNGESEELANNLSSRFQELMKSIPVDLPKTDQLTQDQASVRTETLEEPEPAPKIEVQVVNVSSETLNPIESGDTAPDLAGDQSEHWVARFCGLCGAPFGEDSKFCVKCGGARTINK